VHFCRYEEFTTKPTDTFMELLGKIGCKRTSEEVNAAIAANGTQKNRFNVGGRRTKSLSKADLTYLEESERRACLNATTKAIISYVKNN
jgi:hypothetical protein